MLSLISDEKILTSNFSQTTVHTYIHTLGLVIWNLKCEDKILGKYVIVQTHLLLLGQLQQIKYRIAQNFDGGKFWRFWCFPARLSKFNPLNCLKTIQHLEVYGERQWPSVKIISIKYLKSQYPSKFCAIRYVYNSMLCMCKVQEVSIIRYIST